MARPGARSAGRRRRGATSASRGRRPSPSCGRGSPRPRWPAGSSWRPTRWATRWRGGARRRSPTNGPRIGPRGPTSRTPRRVLTGSHLDSVLDGGAYDGPLGVVSALAAVDLMRERGVVPTRPIGVSVFTEEEGSRFGLACLGSRLATGATTWADARERRDRDGVALPDALAAAGLDVGRWRTAAGWSTSRTSAASSSCTSSRAATSSTGTSRSAWPARSGRTGATASTSPARPTTPARPGWRTAGTRC